MSERSEIEKKIKEIKNKIKNLEKKETKKVNKSNSSLTKDLIRSTGQGATFGFGDEIEAGYKSLTRGTSYDDEVKQARGELSRFRKENPLLAYGSEIAGSIPTMVAGGLGVRAVQGAGKGLQAVNKGSKIGQAVKSGAIQGSIYGAGAGEGVEGKALGTVTGGAIGGVAGGVTAKIFPKTTELAKKLMKKDVRLTTGQAFGGESNITGNVIQNIEQSTSSLVGVGSPIQTARINALSDFNRAVIKESLEPVTGVLDKKGFNNLIQKNLKGNELFARADDILTNAYNKELANVSLGVDGVNTLRASIIQNVRNANTSKSNKSKVVKEITNLINGKIENGEISGLAFKELQRDLSQLSASYKISQGGDIFLARIIDNAKKNAGDILQVFNPNSNLKNLDLSKVGMSAIQNAVKKADKTQGIFSTGQFLSALKQNDRSIGKKMTARGEGFLKDTGDLANQIMGNYLPDSGTANRLITGNISVDPIKALAYAPATIGSELAYGPTRSIIRGLLQTPRLASFGARPTTSGLLSSTINQGLLNRGQQQ